MGKPFRTIDQQIDLLEKRNLKFKNPICNSYK